MADSKLKIWISDHVDLGGFKKLQNQLKASAKHIETFAKKTHSIGKKIEAVFTGILKPVGLIGTTLAAASVAMIGWSLKAAGSYEMLQTQLEAVLPSAEAARDAFKETMEFSASTPFRADEIIQARVALEGVGIKGQDAVKAVAEGASALNRNIMDVAAAVRSLETEPLRNLGIQLQKAGNNFTFHYKSKMGIDVEVNEDSFEKAQQAVLKIFEDKFGGSIEKAAETFEGKLSTLQDAWKQFSAKFGAGFMDTAKELVQDIIDLLNNNHEAAEKFGEALGKKVQKAYDTIKKIQEAIENSGKSAEEVFSDAMKASAKVLLDTIGAGLQASLEIWKLIGKTIVAVMKEELLKIEIPGLGGWGGSNRKDWAAYNAGNMTDEGAAQVLVDQGVVSQELANDPNFAGAWSGRLQGAVHGGELSRDTEASIGSALSSEEIKTAITDFTTQIKEITSTLKDDVKTAVTESLTESAPASESGDSGQLYRIKLEDEELASNSLEGIQELIDELKEQDTAMGELAQQQLDSLTKSSESAKKTAEEAATASAANVDSHVKVQDSMRLSSEAALKTAQVADTAQNQIGQAIVMLQQLSARQADSDYRLAQAESQIVSMRS